MLGSDGQRYFMLRERPGLIHDGYNYYTRNPNYFGEIMLYASFNVIVQSNVVWCIYAYMWSVVFMIRMTVKENSLSKKPGYDVLAKRSWFLLPKIGGRAVIAVPFWFGFVALSTWMYSNGGIEKTVKMYL